MYYMTSLVVFEWQLLAKNNRSVLLDAVEYVKPHGGTQQLGTPSQTGIDVRCTYSTMTDILCRMGRHCQLELSAVE